MNTQLTEKEITEAKEVLHFTRRGLYEFIYGLKIIKEKKFFKAYGFETMDEFVLAEFDMARATMYMYLNIGQVFLPIILQNEENSQEVQPVGLFSLGPAKLDILTKLGQPIISELITSGSITLGKKNYTIEDFKQMSRDELRSLITGEKEKVKEEPNGQLEIPFDKVYSHMEKSLDKMITETRACKTLLDVDQAKIEIKIREIAEIMDSYKPKFKI